MLVTKNLAEFCTLLVEELYGELSSRIFAALLNKGRSTLALLVQYTALSPSQVRHGIAVLFQHNLLYWHTDYWANITLYEANVARAYHLVRTGKILEMVESSMGIPAKDVIQNLFLLGQTRLGDLMDAYQQKIDRANGTLGDSHADLEGEGADEEALNGVNGDVSHPKPKDDLVIKSTAHLNSVLCNLVKADLVEVLHKRSFNSPEDIENDIIDEVEKTLYPLGVKGGKGKQEFDDKVAEYLRKIRGDSKTLKRKLDYSSSSGAKRRKLFNGIGTNGTNGVNGTNGTNGVHEEDEHDLDPRLDPDVVVRVNYEKCIVNLRNRRLVQAAIDVYGETTGHVYAAVLKQLTKNLARCRLDPKMDFGNLNEDEDPLPADSVRTLDILDNIKTSLDLSFGIGKAPSSEVSRKAAEQLQKDPPREPIFVPEAEVDGGASSDEDEDESDASSDAGSDDFIPEPDTKTSATANGKVKFADAANLKEEPRADRPSQLRQHLLLLSESDHGFLRHCGQQEWTVDFDRLVRRLREEELDATIEKVSGRKGLRLVRILRRNGKLDEKTLQNVGLLTKSEVQPKMLEMQLAGFVHIQEVPKDSKADPKKSIFLWFCDTDRSLGALLDSSYKTMVRTMQTLEVRRQKEKDVLDLTKRTDVRGREKEVMRKEYFDRYSLFLEQERKLFGQIMRLDDLIGLLRDF